MKKSELKKLIKEVISEIHGEVYNRVEEEMSNRLDKLSEKNRQDYGLLRSVIHTFILELQKEAGRFGIDNNAINGIRTSLHSHGIDPDIVSDVLDGMAGVLDDPHGENN